MKQKYWWYQTEWYTKHNNIMQINGKGERTRKAYSRSLRQLVEFHDKCPDKISEDELQDPG
jgi:hypothetical protein